MALKIPTTQELVDQALANLEAAIGQTAPINEKAFLRVLAALEGLTETGLYKFAAERARQNLALTATGDDLDLLGAEFNTIRKPAEATVLTATLPAITGTIIPATASFIGDANGVRYFVDTLIEAVAGIATLSMTAETGGTIGNLQVGDTLTIVSAVAGAEQTAAITSVDNTGADTETDCAYRPRVLFAMRATTGGSNTTDHKIWAEEVAGVFRAFPYSGKPPIGPAVSYPGDRTVFIESDTTINSDGIPPQSLLDEVRSVINIDPITGRARPALGLVDSTLSVEPIIRTGAIVEIKSLNAPSGREASVKSDIEIALTTYFLNLAMYVEGVDLPQDRNDLITDLTVANIVQDVLSARVSSATRIRFRLTGIPFITSYRLEPGELIKITSVEYVA